MKILLKNAVYSTKTFFIIYFFWIPLQNFYRIKLKKRYGTIFKRHLQNFQ